MYNPSSILVQTLKTYSLLRLEFMKPIFVFLTKCTKHFLKLKNKKVESDNGKATWKVVSWFDYWYYESEDL